MRKYLALIGAWLLPTIFVLAFPADLPGITCLTVLLFPAVGLILIGIFTVCFLLTRTKPQAAMAIVLVAVLGIVGFARGFRWGALLHLAVNQGRYEAIIRRLSQTKSVPERRRICNTDCLLLSEEPLRVTFHYCHCYLNWPDLVYDPTGDLNTADREKLRALDFYLYRTQHLRGDWYIGYFGD